MFSKKDTTSVSKTEKLFLPLTWYSWEVIVAQLVEQSLSIPEGPQFDSSRWQNFIEHLFVNLLIINCIEKTKRNKKKPAMAHF